MSRDKYTVTYIENGKTRTSTFFNKSQAEKRIQRIQESKHSRWTESNFVPSWLEKK